jgi:hypothetical protein
MMNLKKANLLQLAGVFLNSLMFRTRSLRLLRARVAGTPKSTRLTQVPWGMFWISLGIDKDKEKRNA